MYKLVVIKADGSEIPIHVEKQPSLEDFIELIGGWVEHHKALDGKDMLMDEEGWLKNLPLNRKASELLGFPVVGTAIYFQDGTFK